jgi:signal transduction histidine kinase
MRWLPRLPARARGRPARAVHAGRGTAAGAVADIEAAVRGGQPTDDVLALLVRRAAAVVGAVAVTAMTIEGRDFTVRAAAGAPVAHLSGYRIAAGDTLAGLAVRLRRTCRADLARTRYPYEAALAARGLRQVLYAPIPGDGGAYGVIGVAHSARGRFGVAEQHLVELFAGLAAGAVRQRPGALSADRLARDLHDGVAQSLYGISLRARAAQELLRRDPAGAGAPLSQLLQIAASGLAETRGLISDLRPDTLAGDGLAVGLRRLLDTLHAGSGAATSADLAAVPAGMPARQALYRVAQEALQNAARHAAATHVAVRLFHEPPVVVLEVADDGRGFDPDAEFPGRLGLRSMRERAAAEGGRLAIASRPGRGTLVRAEFPAR